MPRAWALLLTVRPWSRTLDCPGLPWALADRRNARPVDDLLVTAGGLPRTDRAGAFGLARVNVNGPLGWQRFLGLVIHVADRPCQATMTDSDEQSVIS